MHLKTTVSIKRPERKAKSTELLTTIVFYNSAPLIKVRARVSGKMHLGSGGRPLASVEQLAISTKN